MRNNYLPNISGGHLSVCNWLLFRYKSRYVRSPNIYCCKKISTTHLLPERNGRHQNIYENGILADICLDDDADFDKYHFMKDKNLWEFEGDIYESDYEIMEILLERKKAGLIR